MGKLWILTEIFFVLIAKVICNALILFQEFSAFFFSQSLQSEQQSLDLKRLLRKSLMLQKINTFFIGCH